MAGLRPRGRPADPEVRAALTVKIAEKVARHPHITQADPNDPSRGVFVSPWPRLLAALEAGECVTVYGYLLSGIVAVPPSGRYIVDEHGHVTPEHRG